MKLKTKILSLVLAVSMLASISAMAAPSWKFAGYELKNGNPYAVLEYEVDENGVPTGNARQNGFASKVEWKHAFYEASFPHMGYARLYLDDKAQSLYAPTTEAVSEQEYRPIYWEAKSPYAIYEVMYSRIPGVMDWKVQPAFERFANKNASVKKEWAEYGFSAFKTVDGVVVDASEYLDTISYKFDNAATYADVVNSYNALYAIKNVNNKDFDIDFIIPRVSQEKLTGPKYDDGKVVGEANVYAVANILADPTKAGYYNDDLLTNDIRNAEVKWVYGGYEAEGTNKMYEVAEIDGVLMDGGDCQKLVFKDGAWKLVDSKKPYIARYTGGNASPDVAWKAVWPEAAYPFNVYERKAVRNNEGKMVWTDEYRPAGKHASLLPSFELTTKEIANGDNVLVLTLTSDLVEDFDITSLIGTDYDFVGSNTFVVDGGNVPAFQNKVLDLGKNF